MTRPGIEPWSPRPLANTLPTRLMSLSINAFISTDVSLSVDTCSLTGVICNSWVSVQWGDTYTSPRAMIQIFRSLQLVSLILWRNENVSLENLNSLDQARLFPLSKYIYIYICLCDFVSINQSQFVVSSFKLAGPKIHWLYFSQKSKFSLQKTKNKKIQKNTKKKNTKKKQNKKTLSVLGMALNCIRL